MRETLRNTQKTTTKSQSKKEETQGEKPKENSTKRYLHRDRVHPINEGTYRLHNNRKLEEGNPKAGDQGEQEAV